MTLMLHFRSTFRYLWDINSC